MNISQRIQLAVGIGLLLPGFGCASIVSGQHAKVSIASNVPNAHVVIRDKRGDQVAVANTPAVVELKRNDKYFLPARYTATVDAPGYQPEQIEIRSTVNPWILGNVVFGGVIGLVVDNASGAAWKPNQDLFAANLQPVGYASATASSAVAQTATKPAAPVASTHPTVPSTTYPGVQTAASSPFGPPSLPSGNQQQITPLPAGQPTSYQASSNWPPASTTR